MKQLQSSRLLGALTVMVMQKMEKKLEMTVEGTTMMHEMTQNPLLVVRWAISKQKGVMRLNFHDCDLITYTLSVINCFPHTIITITLILSLILRSYSSVYILVM